MVITQGLIVDSWYAGLLFSRIGSEKTMLGSLLVRIVYWVLHLLDKIKLRPVWIDCLIEQ